MSYGNELRKLNECCDSPQIKSFAVKESVQLEIQQLEQRIQQKKELLQLLENNPDFEKILTLMRY